MRIIDVLADMFSGKSTIDLKTSVTSISDFGMKRLSEEMAINLIAGLISKCEFKTFSSGKEVRGDEWYLWNIEPNINQNSNQFISELVHNLLLYGEALVVLPAGDQLVIADSAYNHEQKYALFADTFSSVSRNGNAFDRTFVMPDVLFYKLNADNVAQAVSAVANQYNALLSMAIQKYKRSGGRHGKLRVNRTVSGNAEDKAAEQNKVTESFKKYFESENGVVSLPNGYEYEEIAGDGSKKSTSDVVDIRGLTEETLNRVSQAYKVPPALLRGEVADADNLTSWLLTACIDPLCRLIETENNRKRYGKAVLKGNYTKIDTSCIKHVDIFDASAGIDKLLSDGIYSIDELRGKIGDVPIGTAWSENHWITKNYQNVEEVNKNV